MDTMLKAHSLLLMAGGSISGDQKPLTNDQRVGVTLAGLGIVIAALALLVLVIFCFGKIFDSINAAEKAKADRKAAEKAPKPAAVKAVAPAPAPAPAAPAASPAPPAEDEDEVIAVISAVVAMMSEADGTTYRVKSVRPASGFSGRSAWAMDGRRNNVSPF
ncbi:MAG: OadG family protein [Oscillospiraceae bacterium]|nr:OadG family protein [Oscillospiraceae bacterium]